MRLLSLSSKPVNKKYYSEQFIVASMAIIRDHIKRNGPELRELEPSIAYRYQGNFFGLLKFLDIPDWQKYLTLHLNGLFDPSDFTGDDNLIQLVPTASLSGILNQWK
jgi:hypothetical protein